MRYTRDELEALSAAPSPEAQALRWAEAHAALAAAGFSGDYDGLLATAEPVNRRGRSDSGGGRKALAPQFTGMSRRQAAALQCSEATMAGAWRDGDLGVHQAIGEPFDQYEGAEYDEDDSEDDYDGILKPAFAVDGEPDFESGEPLDGFEYLRRVRHSRSLTALMDHLYLER